MKRILTIAITVAAIAAFAVACGPDKSDDKKLEANNSFVYDKTNTPIGWAGVYEKDNVYTIWLAAAAPASVTPPVTIANGVIITLPKALLGVATTIGSNGVAVKLNAFPVDGTTVTVTIEGTTLSVDIPKGAVGGKYFDSRYTGAFVLIEDEVIPDTPFIDQLVGTWNVYDEFTFDMQDVYYWTEEGRVHFNGEVPLLIIVKINETTVEIQNFTGVLETPEDGGDVVRATVDNDAKTLNIPAKRKLTPAWYDPYETYLAPCLRTADDMMSLTGAIEEAFPAQTFTVVGGKLTMAMLTCGITAFKDNDVDMFTYAVLDATAGTFTTKYYEMISIGTIWEKISDSTTPAPALAPAKSGRSALTLDYRYETILRLNQLKQQYGK